MASVTGVMPFQHVADSRHNRGSVGGGGICWEGGMGKHDKRKWVMGER